MADLLTVSRSGYYARTKREQAGPSSAQQRRQTADTKIIKSHHNPDQLYDSPRTLADLREAGVPVSRKTVAKLMHSNGIVGISPRGLTPTTTWSTWPQPASRTWSSGDSMKVC